jgi:hypothetical protein
MQFFPSSSLRWNIPRYGEDASFSAGNEKSHDQARQYRSGDTDTASKTCAKAVFP